MRATQRHVTSRHGGGIAAFASLVQLELSATGLAWLKCLWNSTIVFTQRGVTSPVNIIGQITFARRSLVRHSLSADPRQLARLERGSTRDARTHYA